MRRGFLLQVCLLGAITCGAASIQAGQDRQTAEYLAQEVWTGTIGEAAQIQLHLSGRGSRWDGEYFYERFGRLLQVEGSTTADGKTSLQEPTGEFAGTIDVKAATFVGTWRSADGLRALPFSLRKAAKTVTLTTDDAAAGAISTYPEFTSNAPAFVRLNRNLAKTIRSTHLAFVDKAQRDWRDWQRQNGHEGWLSNELGQHCRVIYYSKDLVSLLVAHYEYGGGMHGSTSFVPMNFVLRDGEFRPLKLSDLFIKDSNFAARLSKSALRELRRKKASSVVDGAIKALAENQLAVFTLSPEGIQFWFAEYEVGCYAEGVFDAMVTWDALRTIVDPKGPAAKWLGKK
jgi:hypothetical protein